MQKPLEGLLVIELATYWVGPSAGAYLRSQGARVIKVEQPPAGDSTRYFARTCGVPYTKDENPIHDVSNGGKECITLDLKDPQELQLLHNMLAKADVFLTSVRQGGLERLGLDYEAIKDRYPRLIYAHGTAYGRSGPLSSLPGAGRCGVLRHQRHAHGQHAHSRRGHMPHHGHGRLHHGRLSGHWDHDRALPEGKDGARRLCDDLPVRRRRLGIAELRHRHAVL